MSTVRPFKAVRPAKGLESSIAALPYDVFNRKEAKEYVETCIKEDPFMQELIEQYVKDME